MITNFLQSTPVWGLLLIGSAFLIILFFLIFFTFANHKINKIAKEIAVEKKSRHISKFLLIFFSRKIERLSTIYSVNLSKATGLDSYRLKKLEKKPRAKIIQNLLKSDPDKSLFPILLGVIKKPSLADQLNHWFSTSGELMVMRKLAYSCQGQDFDGSSVLPLVADYEEQLFEMTGDPQWTSRFFAVNVLVHHNKPRAQRLIWTAFEDPHWQIRSTAAELWHPSDREKLYNKLRYLLFNDPIRKVRDTAANRIDSEFQDLHHPDISKLTLQQKIHLVEHLKPNSVTNEEIALNLFQSGHPEIELKAGKYLEKTGTLKNFFLSVTPGDKEGMARTKKLLSIAVGVNCVSFLDALQTTDKPGPLMLAADILQSRGNKKLITKLLIKALEIQDMDKEIEPYKSLYERSLKTVCLRGEDKALELLVDEIENRRHHEYFQEWILANIPERADHIFLSLSLNFLQNPVYSSRKALREYISRMSPDLVLSPLLDLLYQKGPEEVSQRTQQDVFRILCSFKTTSIIQTILEELPLLPIHEAATGISNIASLAPEELKQRVIELLEYPDSTILSHLVAALSSTGERFFVPSIKKVLKSSEPEVRIAGAYGLANYGEIDCLFSLLRDPIEKVRTEAGLIIGNYGKGKDLKQLKEVIFDKNEVKEVKSAALKGLALSSDVETVNLLIDVLSSDSELDEVAIEALSQKKTSDEMKTMLQKMRGISTETRKKTLKAIKMMGEHPERFMEVILYEDNNPLRDLAAEVLDAIGTVDARINHLSRRDPVIRREAASFLSRVGTPKAYRGIVMAARDPDEEVRVQTIKALEKLNKEEGKPILEDLKNDPDKRVRKYTLWALEKMEAKKIT